MLPKEQIAHDLSIVYMRNRYGIDVTGEFFLSGRNGDFTGFGDVKTEHFPDMDEMKKVKVGTGEKGFLGREKKKWEESGYLTDEIFVSMINDYHKAYKRFFELLSE